MIQDGRELRAGKLRRFSAYIEIGVNFIGKASKPWLGYWRIEPDRDDVVAPVRLRGVRRLAPLIIHRAEQPGHFLQQFLVKF